jgi:hypothetical protein
LRASAICACLARKLPILLLVFVLLILLIVLVLLILILLVVLVVLVLLILILLVVLVVLVLLILILLVVLVLILLLVVHKRSSQSDAFICERAYDTRNFVRRPVLAVKRRRRFTEEAITADIAQLPCLVKSPGNSKASMASHM